MDPVQDATTIIPPTPEESSLPPIAPIEDTQLGRRDPIPPAEQPLPPQAAPVVSMPPHEAVPAEPLPVVPQDPVSSLPPSQAIPPIPPAPASNDMEEEGLPMPFKLLIGIVVVLVISLIFFIGILPHLGGGNSGKVTLTYWGVWEDKAIMQPIIDDFQRQNPNVTVNYVLQDPNQYSARLLTRINGGTGPDIFRFHNSWMPMLVSRLSPLPQDVMSRSELTSLYNPVVQKDLVRSGALYGLPLEMDTLSMYVNTDLFQKAGAQVPNTWTDFINVARVLTVKDENSKIKTAGAAIGTYANITHAPDIASMLLAQSGVDTAKLAVTSSNASDALTFYTSFAKDAGNIWDTTLPPSLQFFSQGNVAMYFGYSWDIFTIQAVNPKLKFVLYPVPHLPNRTITVASYWVEGVSNKSTHQKEAMLFLKYLAQKDTQQKLYTLQAKTRPFGEPYARTDLQATLKNTMIYPFVQQAPTATSSIFAGETNDTLLNLPLNRYLENAIGGILNTTSSQTAVDTLAQGVDQVMSKYAGK